MEPVPRVRHPDWLEKTLQRERASSKQVHLMASYRDSHERSVRRAQRDRLEKLLQEMDVRKSKSLIAGTFRLLVPTHPCLIAPRLSLLCCTLF